MSYSREELVYLAIVSEQIERYEDMLEYMKKVILLGQELSIEERNLLSVAYKNSVGSRRTAFRGLSSIEQKDNSTGGKNQKLIKSFKSKIETELSTFTNDIIQLIETHLFKSATTAESKVFYLKMKADYYRYMAEYAVGELHKNVSKNASQAYEDALNIANSELKTTHPIRLGLALNYSVFFYEVLNDPSKACNLAKLTFDDAIADIEHIEEDQYKDATTIMQLIRDNLTLWTNEMQDDDEEGDGTKVENL